MSDEFLFPNIINLIMDDELEYLDGVVGFYFGEACLDADGGSPIFTEFNQLSVDSFSKLVEQSFPDIIFPAWHCLAKVVRFWLRGDGRVC